MAITQQGKSVGREVGDAWLFIAPWAAAALAYDHYSGKMKKKNYWRNVGLAAGVTTLAYAALVAGSK